MKHQLKEIRIKQKEGLTVYADLKGWRVNGVTVQRKLALLGHNNPIGSVTSVKILFLYLFMTIKN